MLLNRNSGFARRTLVVCLLLFSASAVLVWIIYSTEPTAQKEGATKKSPMLVDVVAVERADYTPTIKAMGVVKAAQQIDLKSQVSGQVVAVSENFIPGNFLSKGEWLIKLDQRDYEFALLHAESRLVQAESSYAIEMGEQARASKALGIHDKKVSAENQALILREPQLRRIEAVVKAAKSDVAEAQLALERSQIVMPFDGQILTQSVNLGSQVSPTDSIARIVGTEKYWIESSIPLSQLQWLAHYSKRTSHKVSPVIIRNRTTWRNEAVREGTLKQVIAELDDKTRMARVLVEVLDPLGLAQVEQSISQTPLIAGTYVETELPARTLANTVRLDLGFLRKRDTVWVMQEQSLDIRQVDIVFRDHQYAYIRSGLKNGERVITTDLATVRQGASVRLKSKIPDMQAIGSKDQAKELAIAGGVE